jgi:hypothetical protein
VFHVTVEKALQEEESLEKESLDETRDDFQTKESIEVVLSAERVENSAFQEVRTRPEMTESIFERGGPILKPMTFVINFFRFLRALTMLIEIDSNSSFTESCFP